MRHVVNLTTRSVELVELTPEESSFRAAEWAAWVLKRNARAQEDDTAQALAAAKQAVLDELLTARLTAPDAPQAVKDYAARRR